VVGLDEWASKKGLHYGTIAIDLERRTVIDILPDRAVVSTAAWLAERPSIELIARDRDGLYADASRRGAPHAKQIADRFHLVQNLRAAIERQLRGLERPIRGYRANPERLLDCDGPPSAAGAGVQDEPKELTHISGRSFLLAAFAKVRAMYDAGKTVAAITRELRLTRRIVDKWVRLEFLPERARMVPKSTTPARFAVYLRERWAEGHRNVRRLLEEVRAQGYTGCYSRLAAFIAKWQQKAAIKQTPATAVTLPLDPRTGAVISPIVAAALCIKPRGMLTKRQAGKVDILKRELPIFACMRSLAMRFRGLLRGHDPTALDTWIRDTMTCRIPVMQQFAAKLRHDIDAVRNAIREPWSNGQTEGQINRLKMLKRAMYGRAGIALLCARMRPLREVEDHQI